MRALRLLQKFLIFFYFAITRKKANESKLMSLLEKKDLGWTGIRIIYNDSNSVKSRKLEQTK